MTVIDVAGAQTGGAARWRREAESWIARRRPDDVRLIGGAGRLGPEWMARRELIGRRQLRVAANNMSFLTGSAGRTVLLRNPLHFLWPGEAETIPPLPRRVTRQVPIIRAAARRADRVVVPSSRMAERVSAAVPALRDRLVVRHHPLTTNLAHKPSASDLYILYPSVPAAHKDLQSGLEILLEGIKRSGSPIGVKVTAAPSDLPRLTGQPHLDAIGVQTMAEMDRLWAGATAGYIPYTVESFCYPLAEARSAGVPIIARDTAQNREVGGGSLVGFASDDPDAMAGAVAAAISCHPVPDPSPFDADAYFSWLTTP